MKKSILHLFQIKPKPIPKESMSLGTQTNTTIRENLDVDHAPDFIFQLKYRSKSEIQNDKRD